MRTAPKCAAPCTQHHRSRVYAAGENAQSSVATRASLDAEFTAKSCLGMDAFASISLISFFSFPRTSAILCVLIASNARENPVGVHDTIRSRRWRQPSDPSAVSMNEALWCATHLRHRRQESLPVGCSHAKLYPAKILAPGQQSQPPTRRGGFAQALSTDKGRTQDTVLSFTHALC